MASYVISIHAPRVGSDAMSNLTDFIKYLFQSTLPVWGATTTRLSLDVLAEISIHAPRVGSDTQTMEKRC